MPKVIPIREIETKVNKVSRISYDCTDDQYPSAKAVYDALGPTNILGDGVAFIREGVLYVDNSSDYISDVPENDGVRNVLLNAEQVIKIPIVPLADMPHKRGTWKAGTTHQGIPYSSSRIEEGFVPNFISFHTFMTALQNPNSYLYTVSDVGDRSSSTPSKTYYGTVCSSFCSYVFGFVPNYPSDMWDRLPGVERINYTSLDDFKLGDFLCDGQDGAYPGQDSAYDHVVIITGIVRNKYTGTVMSVVVAEAGGQGAKYTQYTSDSLIAEIEKREYKLFRYNKISEVKHTPSEYIPVGGQEVVPITYRTELIPRKGDKANWLYGKTVELDVLNRSTYTKVELQTWVSGQGWTKLADQEIPDDDVMKYDNLTDGRYRARLSDGTNKSDFCYWMVIDATCTVTDVADEPGKIKISFCATNSKPLFVKWCSATSNGTVHIEEITPEQIAGDWNDLEFTYKPGNYKIRVAFQSDYGVIHTELPSKAITVS